MTTSTTTGHIENDADNFYELVEEHIKAIFPTAQRKVLKEGDIYYGYFSSEFSISIQWHPSLAEQGLMTLWITCREYFGDFKSYGCRFNTGFTGFLKSLDVLLVAAPDEISERVTPHDIREKGKDQATGCIEENYWDAVHSAVSELQESGSLEDWPTDQDHVCDAVLSAAYSGESNSRQFSPWEFECNELNELQETVEWDVWEAYETGISEYFETWISENMDEIKNTYEEALDNLS